MQSTQITHFFTHLGSHRSMLRQSDVARILGVSHQRVSQLRLRHRIEFIWDENRGTWVTTQEEIDHFLERRAQRVSKPVGCEAS